METITVLNPECPIIYGYDLPDHVRCDYDYMEEDFEGSMFIEHNGNYYSVGEFLKTDGVVGYHAAYSESAFSQLLIGIIDGDDENLILARMAG